MPINARVVVVCMKHEFAAMMERGGGAIVNCGSTASVRGGTGNVSPYYSSKHAVMGMTKNVAIEGARAKIRVNAVLPGIVMTDIVQDAASQQERWEGLVNSIPLGVGQPEDVAGAVIYLC